MLTQIAELVCARGSGPCILLGMLVLIQFRVFKISYEVEYSLLDYFINE
jgi:hypothetical protein